MERDYNYLFAPGKIGRLTVKNRIAMTAAMTGYPGLNGEVTDRIIRYYEERAKGGAGIIFTEAGVVDDICGIARYNQLHYTPRCINGLERLCLALRKYGTRVFAQLWHGGGICSPEVCGCQTVSSSDVASIPGNIPRPLTKEEIKKLVKKYVVSAKTCQLAGFDGIEIHAAHGYLIAQFLSPYFNHRTDEYGGAFENRVRLLDEILRAVREETGPGYPISVRISADEMGQELRAAHMTLEDGVRLAKYLDESGLVDIINISNGNKFTPNANCDPYFYKGGWKEPIALAVKKAVKLPTIATNTIKHPEEAERQLAKGISDFVGVLRGHLADPEFVGKAARGREDEIRGCIGCLYCRDPRGSGQMGMRCALNPRLGLEVDYPLRSKDGNGRKTAVVGGGPGGMEAARVLAERGFQVTLFEKEGILGGTMNLAAKPDHKEKIARLIRSMEVQCRKAGVDIRLNTEATPELLKEMAFEAVFAASGAVPVIPAFEGVGLPHVYTAEKVLREDRTFENKKVAVIGSGLTGMETAEILAKRGSRITMVEMLSDIGPGLLKEILDEEKKKLFQYCPDIYTRHQLVKILENGIEVRNLENNESFVIETDTVVLALGVRPRPDFVESFKEAAPQVFAVGDAEHGGRIGDAIRSGYSQAYAYTPI